MVENTESLRTEGKTTGKKYPFSNIFGLLWTGLEGCKEKVQKLLVDKIVFQAMFFLRRLN